MTSTLGANEKNVNDMKRQSQTSDFGAICFAKCFGACLSQSHFSASFEHYRRRGAAPAGVFSRAFGTAVGTRPKIPATNIPSSALFFAASAVPSTTPSNAHIHRREFLFCILNYRLWLTRLVMRATRRNEGGTCYTGCLIYNGIILDLELHLEKLCRQKCINVRKYRTSLATFFTLMDVWIFLLFHICFLINANVT